MSEQVQNITTAMQNIALLTNNIEQVIKGKTDSIQLILTTLIARGHILVEDNPGTGKTMLAKTLAKSISDVTGESGGATFHRIQFTPDLLPMDLLGTHIFDDTKHEFVFKKGPLFTNVLLADEINRASPKVQSALLECLAENQVTIGDITYPLESLFFTIATQNPVEMEGTYPLPVAQLDRFFMKICFGYVDSDTELAIYKDYLAIANHFVTTQQVLSLSDIQQMQMEADHVFIHDELMIAVRNIVAATRKHPDILLGASTRSGIIFLKCAKAYALVKQRTFVTEDDLYALCHAVLDHRLIYRNKEAKTNALKKITESEMTRLQKVKPY